MIRFLRICALFAAVSAFNESGCAQTASWAMAMDGVGSPIPAARVVVLDIRSGKILASLHSRELGRAVAAPGSALKPILLFQSVQSGLWNADRTVPCQRNLQIREHRLVCSHPPGSPFAAREALAWSCNTYFAEFARAIPPDHLEQMLRTAGLLGLTHLAPDESVAQFRKPRTLEDAELEVLGVEGIRVTPLELAAGYRWLAQQMAADPNSIATKTVLGGLIDSATFGMAEAARSSGVAVAGKTGTAETIGSQRTHGWFAGFAPVSNPEIVIVVYLPVGRGADAARIAGEFLKRSPLVRR